MINLQKWITRKVYNQIIQPNLILTLWRNLILWTRNLIGKTWKFKYQILYKSRRLIKVHKHYSYKKIINNNKLKNNYYILIKTLWSRQNKYQIVFNYLWMLSSNKYNHLIHLIKIFSKQMKYLNLLKMYQNSNN
jgi:hypothetical protein